MLLRRIVYLCYPRDTLITCIRYFRLKSRSRKKSNNARAKPISEDKFYPNKYKKNDIHIVSSNCRPLGSRRPPYRLLCYGKEWLCCKEKTTTQFC